MSTPGKPPRLFLSGADAVLCALPVCLTYYPSHALVVLGLDADGGVSLAAAKDLTAVGENTQAVCESMLRMITGNHLTGAIVAIIDARDQAEDLPHRDLAEEVCAMFAAGGVTVYATLWAQSITEGAAYGDYTDLTATGLLSDPRAHAFAAAAVAAGQQIRRSRADITVQLGTAPITDTATLTRLCREVSAAHPDDGAATTQRRVRRLRDALAAAERGELPGTAEQLAELTDAVTEPAAWHTVLGLDTPRSGALWLHLARLSPDEHRADFLCLAAGVLLSTDTILATQALATACDIAPGHPLSTLLLGAIGSGISPDDLTGLLRLIQAEQDHAGTPRSHRDRRG